MPEMSAPPSFYNNVSQMGATGGGATPPGGGPPPQADDAQVLSAVGKIASAMKKMGEMKPGAAPYIQRAVNALTEMLLEVFKADPKSVEALGGEVKPAEATPPPAAAPPMPEAGAPPPPPPTGAPA